MKDWLTPSSWELQPEPSTLAPGRWSNRDMDPVPPEKQTWSARNYVAYWISDAACVSSWELASSMIAIGLSWRQALPAIAIGYIIVAFVMVLNGTIGARLHVSFPVLNRSSFGFWFSYFTVISRIVLAMFWFSVQTYTGSESLYQMLKAIWPSIAHIPNKLPQSANLTTVGAMCYFLFWLFQFPFFFVSPQKIKYLFMAKALIVPASWLAIMGWSIARVPLSVSLATEHTTLSGAKLSWAWLSALNSAIGSFSTLTVNIPDFTRYARTPRAQLVQLAIIPVVFTLIGFVGIVVTLSASHIYHVENALWDPLTLINLWTNRPAAFFASFSFALATLGTNLSANSISAGNDMSVLAPRWINIRRGQILCAFIGGWALCPWEILANANGFLAFAGGYAVFLGPFAGIMIVDLKIWYWLVHRERVDVAAMYDPDGRYRYWNGINWRAFAALVISVTPNMPGLISSINPKINAGGAAYVFDIAWIFGFTTAGAVYWLPSALFPAHETFVKNNVSELKHIKESSTEKFQDEDEGLEAKA